VWTLKGATDKRVSSSNKAPTNAFQLSYVTKLVETFTNYYSMSSTNVSFAISEAQSALDNFVEDGSVQEGAYVELSNHLKKIKEEKEDEAEEVKKMLLAELIVANPFIIGTPFESMSPIDIDLARGVIKLARSKKCLPPDWWNEFISAYKDVIFDYTVGIFDAMDRAHAFAFFVKHLCCKEEVELCKVLRESKICFVCHFQEDFFDGPATVDEDQDAFDNFLIDILSEAPGLVVSLHECTCKAEHKSDYDLGIQVARDHACCHWSDKEFERVVGKKSRKRGRGKSRPPTNIVCSNCD